jgi:hypothetical protein
MKEDKTISVTVWVGVTSTTYPDPFVARTHGCDGVFYETGKRT